MSRKFIKGMLAEKAKIANTLIAEVPDDLLVKYHESLKTGSAACHNLYADLRGSDTNDDPELIKSPPKL